MRAYLAIKYHPDHANRERIEGLSAALAGAGVETRCVIRDVEGWGAVSFSPAELMARSFAELDACDLVVVDLTEKGVGVGIEAGYAYRAGIPVITVARRGADVSETLRGISAAVLFYTRYDELDFSLWARKERESDEKFAG